MNADELDLTSAFIALYERPIARPLLGPDGSLRPAIESECAVVVESFAAVANTTLEALADPDLVDVDLWIEPELDALAGRLADESATEQTQREVLREVAAYLAEGAVYLNLIVPPSQFNGIVTTAWIVAAAARVPVALGLRERALNLVALEREIRRGCNDLAATPPVSPDRLAAHLYADMLKARRRR